MAERVICHLCARSWLVSKGHGREAYTDHYRRAHTDLENERGRNER